MVLAYYWTAWVLRFFLVTAENSEELDLVASFLLVGQADAVAACAAAVSWAGERSLGEKEGSVNLEFFTNSATQLMQDGDWDAGQGELCWWLDPQDEQRASAVHLQVE